MTDINHRRKNKKPVNQRYHQDDYHNGYAYNGNKQWKDVMAKERNKLDEAGFEDVRILGEYKSGAPRIGRTDYLDKSMHGAVGKSNLSDKSFSAHIGNDFVNGHRGMAKDIKGAKKFIRSRIRFHENATTKKLYKMED